MNHSSVELATDADDGTLSEMPADERVFLLDQTDGTVQGMQLIEVAHFYQFVFTCSVVID
jgi:hypothetical protein